MRSTRLEARARAKVNLDLRVLGRRDDGYHDIDTLFARIALHDTVAVSLRDDEGIRLDVEGDAGGAAETDNLAHRAAVLLKNHTGFTGGYRIELTKRIPAGAGLGGGSADAATTLDLCNRLLPRPVDGPELIGLAGSLGADVAFLVAGAAAAWGTGRGDTLAEAELPDGGELLLALPAVHVDTAEAYGRLARARAGGESPDPGPRPDTSSWSALGAQCTNDFEPVVHDWFPRLRELHSSLASTDPTLVRMSGSGAAHFAVFGSPDQAEHACALLAASHPDVRFVRSRFE